MGSEATEQQKPVTHDKFILNSDFDPKGDQPEAIVELVEGYKEADIEDNEDIKEDEKRKRRTQTLLGVTGSGKTFTAAHVIAQVNKPTLIMAPNKTLAAQLYAEMSQLFPEN